MNEDGTRNVLFELNGMRREVAVIDQVLIKKGDNVKAGELLITLK